MPRGWHGEKGKPKQNAINQKGSGSLNEEDQPPFFSQLPSQKTSPLVTLLFQTKTAQYAALARIEAFYESSHQTQTYLSLEEADAKRICQHYEAFNFPLDVVRKWLSCMKQKVQRDTDGKSTSGDVLEEMTSLTADNPDPWWSSHCNEKETALLLHLTELGVIDEQGELPPSSEDESPPIYLISTLATKQASLQHERLHFLYHISTDYRSIVEQEYQNLSAKSRKIIEQDLIMRKYSSNVWVDEFQAYISENPGEFGRPVQQECLAVQATLRRHQHQLWRELEPF